MAETRRILHLVTDLHCGGAERMLARLVATTEGRGLAHEVVSLTTAGPVGESVRAAGATVSAIGLAAGSLPAGLPRLAATVRRSSADLVQCWMYHANLVGGVVTRVAARVPVVWSVRNNSPRRADLGLRTALVARAAAPLSWWIPRRIVAPSAATAAAHAAAGYAAARMAVIPNGFDTELFRPSAERRAAMRAALGVGPDERLIGLVANVRPVKDHGTFVAAAARLAGLRALRFVLCGRGAEPGNLELRRRIDASGLGERFLLLGSIERVHELLPALDLFTLCSRQEAFPNALGEAMACALPSVATDVGGVRELAGETVRLVPRQDPIALATAWHEVLVAPHEERARLGDAARRRITDGFSLSLVAARYASLYEAVLDEAGRDAARATLPRRLPSGSV
jgi:glycosyltransferase involved in cell wall biosynthesis